MSKSQLRAQGLQARRAIPHALLVNESRLVEGRLAEERAYVEARTVATYVSTADEVQTDGVIRRMLAEGKRVAVPRVDLGSQSLVFHVILGLDNLSTGLHGILEPSPQYPRVELSATDLVFVPLVSWDDRGHRIGSGMGYFDRALASRGNSVAVGLALESQRVARVPEVPSDVPLDMVVTEKRVLKFGRGLGR